MGDIGIVVSLSSQNVPSRLLLLLLLLSAAVSSDCTCDADDEAAENDKVEALKFKLAAVASILIAGAVGVSLPLLAKRVPALRPESHIFFMVKAFAAGVILATGFVHILPDAFDRLRSPCLAGAWLEFPFAGLFAMGAAILALLVDAFAAGLYDKKHSRKAMHAMSPAAAVVLDEESAGGHHVHTHTHPTHGHGNGHTHTHGAAAVSPEDYSNRASAELIRNRIVSQVLELGIVVHSLIIGVSLGASGSSETIKALMGALSFHQFFEGMGLGGCISQARFEVRSMAVMTAFFCLTTPAGIGIGIAIAGVYQGNSPTALIVEGALESASAGILIYMALVDLLAADFMNPKLQSNVRLHLGATLSLLLGAASMSVLAKWA